MTEIPVIGRDILCSENAPEEDEIMATKEYRNACRRLLCSASAILLGIPGIIKDWRFALLVMAGWAGVAANFARIENLHDGSDPSRLPPLPDRWQPAPNRSRTNGRWVTHR